MLNSKYLKLYESFSVKSYFLYQPEELIRQGKRISDNVPTLHNIDPYNVVVKVGHKLDSTKEPVIFKV